MNVNAGCVDLSSNEIKDLFNKFKSGANIAKFLKEKYSKYINDGYSIYIDSKFLKGQKYDGFFIMLYELIWDSDLNLFFNPIYRFNPLDLPLDYKIPFRPDHSSLFVDKDIADQDLELMLDNFLFLLDMELDAEFGKVNYRHPSIIIKERILRDINRNILIKSSFLERIIRHIYPQLLDKPSSSFQSLVSFLQES